MLKPFLLLVAASAMWASECAYVETRYGRLLVTAIDPTGAPIPEVTVELAPDGPGLARINAREGTRLLYGEYQVRVYASGFAMARRTVRIYQPETVLRVELTIAAIGCPPDAADIGGRIKRNGHSGELWVKAIPVNGVSGSESRVSPGGSFVISGLDYSAYVVLVMEGEKVLHQEVVKTYPVGSRESTNLLIDLKPAASRP